MSHRQVCAEALTFLIAGHETTARGLTRTLYLLASNPHIKQRLHEEIDNAIDTTLPSLETLPKLRTVRMAVKESLRLYPPVWVVTRPAMAVDEIDGFHIP